ncbi:hypothetical protein G7054_g6745 [Neopestalotiopsis clavispora]|nr:hypothetical protein G7054_g6745 [Neopestalotiopsis clavispora]
MSLYSRYPLDGVSDIRLLILHPAPHPDDAVVCDLVVASLGTKPYTALSYTWGPPFEGAPSGHRSITLCDASFHVTENLFQALAHLRNTETSLLLWVDAICIDQNDNLERNHQVARMANIYRSADQVYAWLGVDSAIYDGAITFKPLELAASIESIERDRWNHAAKQSLEVLPFPFDLPSKDIRERLEQAAASDAPNLSYLFSEINNPKHDLGAFLVGKASSWSSSSPRSDPEEMVQQALKTFRSRNYFFRRWVIQEITLAQEATLVCGNSRIKWSVLADARMSFIRFFSIGHSEEVIGLASTLLISDIWTQSSLLGTLLGSRLNEMRQDPSRLLEIVRSCAWAQCEDPRDRIYSLMSLFPVSSLQPDYRISPDIVYTQFARAVIENGGGGQLFNLLLQLFTDRAYCDHVAKKVQSLPSWVPDWDFPEFTRKFHLYSEPMGTSYVENVEVILENVLSCKFLKCCKVVEARKPHLPCSNLDASCRKSDLPHISGDDPNHRCQFLRIGQPGQQSPDSLPHEGETVMMEPEGHESVIEVGDIMCCLAFLTTSMHSMPDGFARFVILRRFTDNSSAYRLVGACLQRDGTSFNPVAGPLELRIN